MPSEQMIGTLSQSFIDQMPRLDTGKVDAPVPERGSRDEYAMPKSVIYEDTSDPEQMQSLNPAIYLPATSSSDVYIGRYVYSIAEAAINIQDSTEIMSAVKTTDRVSKAKRSRNGCAFCKEKRLKCDETKPQCTNCTSRDRTCPGYKPVLKWKTTPWQPEITVPSPKAASKQAATPALAASHMTPIPSVDQSPVVLHDERSSPAPVDHFVISASRSDGVTSPIPIDQQSHAGSLEDTDWHDNGEGAGSSFDMNSPFDQRYEVQSNVPDASASAQLAVDLDGLDVRQLMAQSGTDHAQFAVMSDPLSDFVPFVPFSMGSAWLGSVSTGSAPVSATLMANSSTGRNLNKKDVRKLLTQFYTTQPKLSYPLFHQGTKLVEHYFSKICAVYSCFDSFLNPFRSVVGQQWSNSASTYYAIQSMAAAHLANELPFMKKEGLELHRQASEHLGKELVSLQSSNSMDDQPLLTLLLLGMSACWQRPGDLGLPFLRTARSFLRTNLRKKNSAVSRPLLQLFEEAMIYWEMVTSFVASDSDIDILQAEKLSQMDQPDKSDADDMTSQLGTGMSGSSTIIPHPWTGISPESQILLGQVGKVVYAVRTQHVQSKNHPDYVNIALSLEESLLDLTFPESTAMVNCGDGSTRPIDFITLAEITRDAGLLELYRVFPMLLQRRLPQDAVSLPLDIFDDLRCTSTGSNPRGWLTSLALHILERIESIPPSSHVRVHQLLPIIIAACELRFPTRSRDMSMSLNFSEEDTKIYQARKFARERLHQLASQLPAQPVHVMLELITEVWQRLDTSTDDNAEGIFWVDIMVEKGWYTLMG
ncbi:Beauvericin cluster-specific repressor BEA4-like protein [Elsinoe fawcettii]|nr:Beauvericin cluster-specific repressor BEA4-like protein [Elsinoe fawcettii]